MKKQKATHQDKGGSETIAETQGAIDWKKTVVQKIMIHYLAYDRSNDANPQVAERVHIDGMMQIL